MKHSPRYFLTGLFVLIGFLLFALGCVLFGGSELFSEKVYFETYFATSVQGLDAGGAVKFRGVPIGKVESITFTGDTYAEAALQDETLSAADRHQMLAYVQVRCSIDNRQFPSYSAENLRKMVQQGLRTSLGMQGITGIVFVNLDYKEVANCSTHDLKIAWTPEELYIPSCPTILQTVVDVAEKLCKNLEKIDFAETMTALTTLTTNVDTAIAEANLPRLANTFNTLGESLNQQTIALAELTNSLDMKNVGQRLGHLMENMEAASQSLREALPSLTQQAGATMGSLQDTLAALKGTLGEINQTVADVHQNVDFTSLGSEAEDALHTIARAAASLEVLIDEIRGQPSRLIFDDPIE